jgi:hypothetical protein
MSSISYPSRKNQLLMHDKYICMAVRVSRAALNQRIALLCTKPYQKTKAQKRIAVAAVVAQLTMQTSAL